METHRIFAMAPLFGAALHACAVRAVRPLTAPGAVACPQWPLGVVRPGESRVDLHWISQAA